MLRISLSLLLKVEERALVLFNGSSEADKACSVLPFHQTDRLHEAAAGTYLQVSLKVETNERRPNYQHRIIFIAAIGSIMYNNSRITDLRTDTNARAAELRSDLGKRIDDLRDSVNRRIDDKFQLLDAKLDRILEMLATHDQRLYKLENPK